MALIWTESIRYNTDITFGEIINKFQNSNIKTFGILKEKVKKLQNDKDSIILSRTCLNIYIRNILSASEFSFSSYTYEL